MQTKDKYVTNEETNQVRWVEYLYKDKYVYKVFKG